MTTSQLRPLTELQALESESIHIIREVVATFASPIMLFSGGKDSVVMLHLAAKAFWPAPLPFGVLHVDTGHNFGEVLQFRDEAAAFYGASLKIASVQDYIDDGRLRDRPDGTRNPLQTVPLLDAITDGRHDAVFGGGRRDEERARAKERVFSMRDEFGQWEPRNQRPELWSLYNGRHLPGEHVRVFPLSNWTELDVWDYIAAEKINVPRIYYSHERQVTLRDGMWIAITDVTPARPGEVIEVRSVRYRTVGDMSCTAAILSNANTVQDVISEVGAGMEVVDKPNLLGVTHVITGYKFTYNESRKISYVWCEFETSPGGERKNYNDSSATGVRFQMENFHEAKNGGKPFELDKWYDTRLLVPQGLRESEFDTKDFATGRPVKGRAFYLTLTHTGRA